MERNERPEDLRFNSPPVRRTRLSLTFEPNRPLRISDIAPLLERWSDRYVTIEESPPDPDAFQRVMSGDGGAWPMPALRLIDESGTESIQVQSGRFDLEWNFSGSDEGITYPGYEVLEQELSTRFDEFVDAVRVHGMELTLIGSQCRYENPLPGMQPAQAAVGLLSGWNAEAADYLPGQGYVGVRLHACAQPETHSCTSYVALDGDIDDIPVLSIVVDHDDDNQAESLGGLRQAHDELLDLFWRYTDSNQHSDWGLIEK